MTRTTSWRHKKGISKKKYPKGDVDYRKVANYLLFRYFRYFYTLYPEDALQEVEVIIAIAERQNSYGKNTRLGITRFSRLAQRHFYRAAKSYGFFRGKNAGQILQRDAIGVFETRLVSPSGRNIEEPDLI